MPSIRFNYLLCTYLPALPLALAVYLRFNCLTEVQIEKLIQLKVNFNNSQLLYILVAPLLLGLCIDFFRHFIATLFKIFKIFHNRIFWEYISPDNLETLSNIYKSGLTYILGIERTLFSTFEFFFNLAISALLSLHILPFENMPPDLQYPIKVIAWSIIFLSFGTSLLLIRLKIKIINDFKTQKKYTNERSTLLACISYLFIVIGIGMLAFFIMTSSSSKKILFSGVLVLCVGSICLMVVFLLKNWCQKLVSSLDRLSENKKSENFDIDTK